MNKWYGKVGYIMLEETEPGVWEENVIVRKYYGDILRNRPGWQTNSESTNDNLTVNSQISIVLDDFAYQQSHFIKFVEFMGSMWEVDSIEPQYPRLILTLGGVWNGKQA